MPAKKLKIDPERSIMLFGGIDEELAGDIIKELLILDGAEEAPIYILINSEGGDVHSSLAILDTINSLSSTVIAVGMGQVMSGASLIFASCKKRVSLPNTWFMLHSISFSLPELSRQNLEFQAKHSAMLCDQMYALYAKFCKKPKDKIKSELESGDILLDCKGALEYGILDEIITKL